MAGRALLAFGFLTALPAPLAATGWAAEALTLSWMGARWHRRLWRNAANLLGLCAALGILLSLPSSKPTGTAAFTLLSLVLLGASVSLQHRRAKQDEPGAWEWASRWLLTIVAALLPMLFLSQITAAFSSGPGALAPMLTTSLIWASYSAAMCLIGWFTLSAFLRWMGVSLLLVTAMKVFLVDPVALSPVSRIVSFLLLSVFLLLLSYLFQTRRR